VATSHSSVTGSPYASSCPGAADPNYTIGYVDGSVTVKPAPLTITASGGSMTYGNTPTVTAGYSGFVNGDAATNLSTQPSCSTVATSHSSVTGSPYASSCSGAADPNYTIGYVVGSVTVKPAPLTITASGGSMTYGGTPPTITVASYLGFVNGDAATNLSTQPSCSTVATSHSSVTGSPYASSCSGAADPNYTIGYVVGSVTVKPAPLTITASGGSMTYGGTPPDITVASYSGFVNSDGATNLSTQPSCTSTASGSSPAGSYASSCSGAADANYAIGYVDGSVTVKPAALTITAASGSTSYGTAPTITASYSGFVNRDSSASLSTPPSCTSTATNSSPPGSYTSSCSGAEDSNYSISYVDGSVTVKPAALTITASSGSTSYGTAPTITASYSGFVNRDSSASLSTPPSCTSTATNSSPPGSYTSSCSGAEDSNYSIGYVSGTVTIGQATPTVSVSSQSGQTTGPVTISVSVSGATGVDVPTGSITVSDTTNNCSITAIDKSGNGSCALIENASQDSQPVTASYSGDTNYVAATGTTTVAVSPAKPTLSVSGPSSAVTGWITYSVTVSGPGAAPSGKVTISDGTKTCMSALLQGLGACPLQEATGTYQVTANYNGDANYAPMSVSATEVVNETTTSLAGSTSTVVYGREQLATFSVIVYPPVGDDTAPTGVTVKVTTGTHTLCVTSPLAITSITVTNPVSGLPVQITEATAACHLTPVAIAVGKYSVTAEFPGEPGSFVGSTSTAAPLTVLRAPTSTSLSISSSTTTYGSESKETLTTRVSDPAGPSYVTGSVTVKTGSKTLCIITLKGAAGTCKLARLQLSAGRHSLVADYQGSKSLVSSSSKPLTLSVAKAPTSSALSLSRTTVTSRTEQSERFTAQVAVPAGMAYASGTVTVTSGSKRLCTITLIRGKGTCSLSVKELPVGTYEISARYGGSSELQPSTSLRRKLVVTKAS
jgi:hypothetical protein